MAGASYNIYIHTIGSNGEGGSRKPTQPIKPTENKPTEPTNAGGNFFTSYKNFVNNVNNMKTTAVSAVKKFLPVVVTLAVMKVVDKAASFVIPFYTTETGDYSYQNAYYNFKASVNALFNPVSTAVNIARIEQQNRIFNLGQTQNRLLLGDSTINFNYGKGYNV